MDGERWVVMTCRSPVRAIRPVETPPDARKVVFESRGRPDPDTSYDDEAWTRYGEWNRAVGEEFFDGRFAGRPVYLDLESAILASLAERAGEPGAHERALVEVVSATLNFPGSDSSLLADHHDRLLRWGIEPGDSFPPTLATLAFFSLVAESMAAEDGLAAHNYYGRCCELLGLDPHDQSNRSWIYHGFAKHAADLWQSLNTWLEANEGERGLPTAYAFDFKKNVGPAISQALVKDADRAKLPRMFAAYGLPAGYSLSVNDMERLLAEWLPSSNVSNSLQRAFKKNAEARRRIAAIAQLELETWDGRTSGPSREDSEDAPLRLLAMLRKFLGVRLEFGLAVPGSFDGHEQELRVAMGGDASADALSFVQEGDGWTRLADNDTVRWPDLLTRTFTVTSDAGVTATRRAGRVVVLRYEPSLAAFVETDRAPLGEDCMILAHTAVATEVEAMLSAAARPGFTRADNLRGVPDGWKLFTDVQILASVEPTNIDLQPLTPVAWTQLVLAGGFSLPGRTRKWHRRKPPEVRVASHAVERATVRITGSGNLDPGTVLERELGSVAAAGVFRLEELDLPTGNYEVSLHDAQKGAVLAQTTMRLRDGSRPAAEVIAATEKLLHPLHPENPIVWLTGTRHALEAADRLPHLVGAVLVGDVDTGLERAVPVPERPAWTAPGKTPRGRVLDEVVQVETPASAPSESCVVTGAHHFVLPTYSGRARGPTVSGRCKHCGLTQWWPSRPPKQGEAPATGQAPTIDLSNIPTIGRDEPVDWELLLDGLAHVRRGSWGHFERLARQGEDTALFIHDVGRTLEALGHLEVRRNGTSLDPIEWEVPPATIYDRPDGRFLVTGLRSTALVDQLAREVERLGGRLTREANGEAGPDTLWLDELAETDLRELQRALAHSTAPIEVSLAPGKRLLAQLPSLWAVVAALPRRPVGQGSQLERFDGISARWVACDEAIGPGAYRLHAGRRRYFVRTRTDVLDGYARFADPFTVKHAGATLSNQPLVAYDDASSALLTPLGAELPGLYERAIVLASGRPPQKLRNGMTRYADVPREHAEALAARLFDLPEAYR